MRKRALRYICPIYFFILYRVGFLLVSWRRIRGFQGLTEQIAQSAVSGGKIW